MASQKQYWLVKTEPETYSFEKLVVEGKTHWNGVRNFQARNHLREFKKGDQVLVYHSGDDKAVVGVAEVAGAPYPDPDPKKPGEWLQVDLKPVKALKRGVPLKEIKTTQALATLPLIKQSRLSVMPVTEAHFKTLLKMGDLKGDAKVSRRAP
ncbi:MAG TPA: EVE domain-containing protein [Bdellovibrionota bacterium]|jgi:predicted RNA-binding protein with PUA-like domain|nr:EVE domain-containing protein [Bdellovibrionota bacterium]